MAAPTLLMSPIALVAVDTGLEIVPCDLCGAAPDRMTPITTVHDQIYGQPGDFSLTRCTGCGLLSLNPRPDPAHIGAYYPDLDYHAFRAPGTFKRLITSRLRQSEARTLLAGLPVHPRVLEIGCGTGDLLAALKTKGAQVVGVEPNAAAAHTATDRHAITVHIGILDDIPASVLPDGTFDLIVMKYALEHVHNPRAVLTRIAGLLKPGGKAVLWLPNAASWEFRLFGARWRGLDAPRHLYIFTPKTVDRYAEAAGLTLSQVAYSGVPNDWAGSIGFMLNEAGRSKALAEQFTAQKLPTLALLWPISATAALFHAAGRITVTLIKS